jgi:ABC-2 type transport system permease protein
MSPLQAVWAGARAEALQLRRSPLLVILAVVQAVTFLLLVSLFGLTGSRAPTALVDEDASPLSARLVSDIMAAHHSFALQRMEADRADTKLHHGELIAVITIPKGFGDKVRTGETVALPVAVDNVDADLTDDVQRALPAAIAMFGQELGLPGIHLRPAERDLVGHDTGYIPYLVVSALALDALIVAGVLAAIAVAREFEGGTMRVLAASPVHPLLPVTGRVVTTATTSLAALLVTTLLIVSAYRVIPVNPLELGAGLAGCVVIFSCVGIAIGSLIRRILPVTALVFGIALPLYIDSGSLEPERFDGNLIWAIAHFSPVYYAVGVLEDAVHGLQVTPEPVYVDLLALAGWAVLAMALARRMLRRRTA